MCLITQAWNADSEAGRQSVELITNKEKDSK